LNAQLDGLKLKKETFSRRVSRVSHSVSHISQCSLAKVARHPPRGVSAKTEDRSAAPGLSEKAEISLAAGETRFPPSRQHVTELSLPFSSPEECACRLRFYGGFPSIKRAVNFPLSRFPSPHLPAFSLLPFPLLHDPLHLPRVPTYYCVRTRSYDFLSRVVLNFLSPDAAMEEKRLDAWYLISSDNK